MLLLLPGLLRAEIDEISVLLERVRRHFDGSSFAFLFDGF